MVSSKYFDKIVYHTLFKNFGVDIEHIIGADSEAYISGRPFIFCFSDDKYYDLRDKDFFRFVKFLHDNYIGENIGVWNLKYESGAFLYFLTSDQKKLLWKTGEITLDELKISYIPHKNLRFLWGRKKLDVWDIMQFYHSSLDNAAKTYLNQQKIEIETKKFTVEYVLKNYDKIKTYCMQDCILTARLGDYLVSKVKDFKLRITSLYSQASISLRFFQDHSDIVDVRRFFKNYPDILRYAMDSYQGGKFEITARGFFTGYEYDIISAYPYEIYNLVDTRYCKLIKTSKYQEKAIYGFIRVYIDVYDSDINLPFGLMPDYTRIYGLGRFYTTITKAEYDYLIELKIKVKIISAYWLQVEKIVYPYRPCIDKLMELKTRYKNKDVFLYDLAKKCMNSFYGKMCQMIESFDSQKIVAGVAWNPIHASVITANTRIKVTRIQNELKKKCLAVHTDSVITLDPINDSLIGNSLGDFEKVIFAEGVIVSCGCYEIGNIVKTKGFELVKKETWKDVLEVNKNKKFIPYTQVRVESFSESTAKRHYDKLNLFEEHSKSMSLNADTKRIWSKTMTGNDYLKKLWYSEAKIIFNSKKPKEWL